jgi:ABC-type bacteriocin/lantibiotic exporter with double-glycine peptidase domain
MTNIGWLISVSRAIRGGLLLGLLLVAGKTVANLALTGVQKWIIDDIFLGQNYGLLWPVMFGFALAIVAYNAFHAMGDLTLTKHSYRLSRSLTETFLQTVHRLPADTLQNERTGKLVNHVTGDIQSVASIYSGSLSNGVQQVIGAAMLIVVVAYASPVILISVLAVGALYIPLGKYFGPRLKAASKEVQSGRSDLVVYFEEGVASTREVIAFDRVSWEKRRYGEWFAVFFEKVMKEGKLVNRHLLWSDPLRWGVRLFVLGYGGYEVMRGNLTLGLFVVVYQFSTQLMESVYGIYQFITGLTGRMASVERLREVLDRAQISEGTERLPGRIRQIAFQQVCFRYSEETPLVLDHLTMTLPLQRKIAFVGSSGGGKSTIAQLLIRFREPDSGAISVDGFPLHNIHRQQWTERVAIVFQEPYLFPDTIRANLLMGDEQMDESQMKEACRVACIDDWIEALPLGYDTVLGERGITLSGGQRQRIALARAIARQPDILILDEATSALDLETERNVMARLDACRKERTTIVIAHRLSTIQNADVIYVMDSGKIAEQGTHEQLLAQRGVYESLQNVQPQWEKGA